MTPSDHVITHALACVTGGWLAAGLSQFSERPTLGLSRAELIAFYMCFVAALIKTGHPYESHFADEAHHDYLFQL